MKIKLTQAILGKSSLWCTQFLCLWSISSCLILSLMHFPIFFVSLEEICCSGFWIPAPGWCTFFRVFHKVSWISWRILCLAPHGSLTLFKPELDHCGGWGVTTFYPKHCVGTGKLGWKGGSTPTLCLEGWRGLKEDSGGFKGVPSGFQGVQRGWILS